MSEEDYNEIDRLIRDSKAVSARLKAAIAELDETLDRAEQMVAVRDSQNTENEEPTG